MVWFWNKNKLEIVLLRRLYFFLFSSFFLSLQYCVKSGRIWSFSSPHFSAFEVNTKRYGVSLRIQSESGKTRTRKTPNTDTFHAVKLLRFNPFRTTVNFYFNYFQYSKAKFWNQWKLRTQFKTFSEFKLWHHNNEAIFRRCSSKQVFLKTWQIS